MTAAKRIGRLGVLAMLVGTAPVAAQASAAPDSLPPGVTQAMVVRGQTVYEGSGLCSNCHGPLAGGHLGPNLTDSEWWHGEGSYLALIRQILVGVPQELSTVGVAMPARGGSRISDADVQAVAAYVWQLSHPNERDSLPTGVTPALIGRGDMVFHGEGNCHVCHGEDARGNVGPNLTDDSWLHVKGSYLTILQQVLVGVPAERSRSGIEMPPRGGSSISDADVHAVAAYVWVLSRRRH